MLYLPASVSGGILLRRWHVEAAEDKGNTAQFVGSVGDAFSAICCLQISRFTSSKPSKSAIASDEKCILHRTNSFVRYCPKSGEPGAAGKGASIFERRLSPAPTVEKRTHGRKNGSRHADEMDGGHRLWRRLSCTARFKQGGADIQPGQGSAFAAADAAGFPPALAVRTPGMFRRYAAALPGASAGMPGDALFPCRRFFRWGEGRMKKAGLGDAIFSLHRSMRKAHGGGSVRVAPRRCLTFHG